MQIDDVDNDILLGDGAEETAPPDTTCTDAIFDLAFHPSAPFFAAGLVSGAVEVHEFRRNQTRLVANLPIHTGGITGMEFSEDGRFLITASSDRTINVVDCATQASVVTFKKGKSNPHVHGISSVNVCDENTIATGDDNGLIAVWDLRQKKPTMKYHEHGDFVSQMLYFSEVRQIVSSSGDTTVGAYDMRKTQVVDFSDMRNDELLCMCFVPATNDLICGTNSGMLPVWRWGSWARPYDVYKDHPKECEAILSYNDNIVFTGACDSLVRVIQVYPARRILCHLGSHEGRKYQNGVSRIRISHDRTLLATCCQDRSVRWFDVEFLSDEAELDKLRSKAERRHMVTIRAANAENEAAEAKAAAAAAGFSDDSDDSDDAEGGSHSDDSVDSWEDADSDESAGEAPEGAEEGDSSDEGGDDEAAREAKEAKEAKEAEAQAEEIKETRREKRARVSAAKWLKQAQSERINFKFERRRRRVGGFWGDLTGKNSAV